MNKTGIFPEVFMFIRKKKISKISDLRQGSAVIQGESVKGAKGRNWLILMEEIWDVS